MTHVKASSVRDGMFGPRAAVLVAALIVAACGAGTPTITPSGSTSAGPSSSAPPASAVPATATPASSAGLERLPTGRIAFVRLKGSPEGNYVGTSVLGGDGVERPLTLPIANAGFDGVWSPDGTRLLVDAFAEDRIVVGTLDPSTDEFTEIRPSGMVGELECTDWTPDGSHVICGRGGPDPKDDGIYAVEITTGTPKRLTTSAYHHVAGTAGECGGGESRAVYSGDGSRFAYVQQKCGTGADPSSDEQGAIAIASADGSGVKVIVPLGGVRTHAGGEIAWSPTDDVIAFGTQDGQLSLVAADGTGLRTVDLPQPGFAYGPTWPPDGKWILVTVALRATGQDDLFVVSPDGSTMRQMTDTAEVEAFTDWGSAP